MDELAQAQATLGRSIDRARAGEDPQLAGIVREKGEQMVGLLFGLLRMSRSYAPENPALNQPIGELTSTIARLVGLLGALQLVAVEEQVYLNEIRVRTPSGMPGPRVEVAGRIEVAPASIVINEDDQGHERHNGGGTVEEEMSASGDSSE